MLDLLRHDPELLAIADAVAATQLVDADEGVTGTRTPTIECIVDIVEATSVEPKELLMSDETRQEKKGLYLLHIDGGNKASAAGEMSEGAIGALLKEPNGTAIPGAELSERIGPVESPTTAEYRALLRGLELARERGVNYLAVFSDSRNLVNQMNRLWNAGDNLAKLRDEAEEALRNFKGTQVSWVPRNWNKEADALVNKAFGPKTTEIIRSQE